MAESLSLAASVIAVLQITGSVVSLTYHCGRDMWDAKGDSSRLRAEAEGLQKVLQAAEKLVEGDNTRKPAALRFPTLGELLTMDPDGLAKICAEEVAGVQQALLPPWMAWNMTLMQQTNMGRGLLERAKWPLKKKRLESALEGIGRLQDAIVQAMATDTSRTTADIKTTVDRIDTNMSNLATILGDISNATGKAHESLLTIRSQQAEEAARMAQEREREAALEEAQRAREERETILQRLETPEQARASQYAKYADLRNRRDKKTSGWLLDGGELAALLRPQPTGPSVLWLKGSAGCGKTMLSTAVIEHLQAKRQDAALAYFFFDFNSSEASTSETMIRSLAVQLLSACDAPLPTVVARFAAVHLAQSGNTPSIENVLQLLKDLIQHLALHTTQDVIIVLDALDECADRSKLLQRLGYILKWDLPLRVFMTSHDLPDVASLLDTNAHISTSVVRADSDGSSGDIDIFVRHQLEADSDLMRWPSKMKEKIRQELTSGAGSMFRWVACQIEMLRLCDSEEDVNTALRTLPTTLSATYTAALRRLPKMKRQRTLRVLLWILVAGPGNILTPKLISEFLAVDLNDPGAGPEGICYFKPTRRMLDPQRAIPLMCPALIRMDVVRDFECYSALRLAHSTVKDYLLNSDEFLEAFQADMMTLSLSAAPLPFRSGILDVANAHVCRTMLGYVLSWHEPEDKFNEGDWPLTSHAAFRSYGEDSWLSSFRRTEAVQTYVQDLVFALFKTTTKNSVRVFANYMSTFPSWHNLSRNTRPCSWQLRAAYHLELDIVVEKLLTDQLRDGSLDSSVPLVYSQMNFANYFGMSARQFCRTVSRKTGDLDKTLWKLVQPYYYYEVNISSKDPAANMVRSARDILAVLATRLPDYAFFVASGWDSRGGTDCLYPPENRFAAALLGGPAALAQHMVETGEVDVERPLWTTAGWEAYPLFLSVFAGEREVAVTCLHKGAPVDQVGYETSCFRPLALAVWAGRLDLVKLLVEHGADINATCSMYGTPLQTAAFKGHHTVVKYLLGQPGIDVKRAAHQSTRFDFTHMYAYWTPLQIAVSRNLTRVAELLLPLDLEAIWTKTKQGNDFRNDGRDGIPWTAPVSLLEMASGNGNIYLARQLFAAFKQQSAQQSWILHEQRELSVEANMNFMPRNSHRRYTYVSRREELWRHLLEGDAEPLSPSRDQVA